MSVQAMTRVMDASEARGVNRLVLLVMANRAGGDHDECFASVDRLAHECRIAHRTVQNAMKRLVAGGDLAFVGVHPKYRTNIYHVMPQGVQEMHPPAVSGPADAPELKEPRGLGSRTTETSVLPTSLAPSRRDGIYEALFPLETGEPYSPEARQRLTKTGAKALATAAAEINLTGVTPAELAAAIQAWPVVMGDATCTAHAVKKHLGRLRAASQGLVARRHTSELDDALAELDRRRAAQ